MIGMLLAIGTLTLPGHTVAAQRGAGGAAGAATVRSLAAKAAKGDFAGQGAYDELRSAGMSDVEANKAMEHIADEFRKFEDQRAAEQKKKADDERRKQQEADQKAREAREKDLKENQNESGQFEWDFGAVYRDRDYPVVLPLENRCKVPREITIFYPKGIQLSGPEKVTVPAKGKVDVKMQLTMTTPPMPPPPYPPGFSPACYDMADHLALAHQEFVLDTPTSQYKCLSMSRLLAIKMHVHQHAPPGGGGGGGGGGTRPDSCDVYWNTGEFFPTREKPTPEACETEMRVLASDFFGRQIDSVRAADPAGWSWAPSRDQINGMSVPALLQAKSRADAIAAPRY